MEAIFRALADPTRRRLLDLLKEREPLTLSQLVEGAGTGTDDASMTRFGVMKHLGVLEDAGLIATRKSGREKLHYLNAAPIQLVADRWISRFAKPLVQQLADVKTLAELGAHTMHASNPRQVYEVFIKASPEQIWAALTQPDLTEKYYYGSRVETALTPGSPFRYVTKGENPLMIEGKVLEAQPPKKLVTTFSAQWSPENKKDRPSRVTYEITPMDGYCKLSLVHDDFDGETETYRNVAGGWMMILSGLKTLLETGKPMGQAA